MNQKLRAFLDELERRAIEHDVRKPQSAEKLHNITGDTGILLWILARSARARRALDVGSSNGFAAICLGDAVSIFDGSVLSVEYVDSRLEATRESIARAGLAGYVEVVHDDPAVALTGYEDGWWDLIFLDAEHSDYARLWPDVSRTLRPGGLVVIDNALTEANEIQALPEQIREREEFTSVLMPIGEGQLVAHKSAG